ATASLLPIVRAFAKTAGINVETSDISLATRILSQFPDYLTEEQQVPNTLKALGELTLKPEANIIKLPNISASVSQLHKTVKNFRTKALLFQTTQRNPKQRKKKRSMHATASVLVVR